jgi:hypothetical protein
VNDMQKDEFEGLATKLAAKSGKSGPEVARILPMWNETTRSPGVLKQLLGKKELGESSKTPEEVIISIENEALACVKNHLKMRPDDEKALRKLANISYEEGVPKVDFLDLIPAKGSSPLGPSDDFFTAKAVTTDTEKFRFASVAAHTEAKKHFQGKDREKWFWKK